MMVIACSVSKRIVDASLENQLLMTFPLNLLNLFYFPHIFNLIECEIVIQIKILLNFHSNHSNSYKKVAAIGNAMLIRF